MYVNGEQKELNKILFSTMKDIDDYIQFSFFTGVTTYSNLSIFSDFNTLKNTYLFVAFLVERLRKSTVDLESI